MEKVTLLHVAEAAGVSVSTASRSLTGKARQYRIRSETERLVREAADRMGFEPSHVARSLRTQRSGLIGIVVPDISNPFFAAIAREITIASEEHGLSVILADSRETTSREATLVQQLQSRQVEGLVVCPVGETDRHLRQLENATESVVLVDRVFPSLSISTVTSDHESGAFRATRELIRRGHRKIACLQGRPGTLTNDERIIGYKRALAAERIAFRTSRIAGDHFSEDSGYRASGQILDTQPRCTAMFAFNNQIAIGALRRFAERRLSIPQDLSLITFDDHPLAEFLASPLTVARQDAASLGKRAAKLLLSQRSSSNRRRSQTVRVPVQLIRRQSVGDIKSG